LGPHFPDPFDNSTGGTIHALNLFESFFLFPGHPFLNLLDFYFCVLEPEHPEFPRWQLVKSLVESCGLVFLHQQFCLICERPQRLNLDEENRLHGEGEPVVQYADGLALYAHQGVSLPEEYGTCHPHQWQAQWLLQEPNVELRRVLIQGIGYGRLCQELEAVELDIWQEYTLLKVTQEIDVEPVFLLKMKCPSTGYIHVVRVPPQMESARAAICWINWGIDPQTFVTQA
jgi:hypothetical protein